MIVNFPPQLTWHQKTRWLTLVRSLLPMMKALHLWNVVSLWVISHLFATIRCANRALLPRQPVSLCLLPKRKPLLPLSTQPLVRKKRSHNSLAQLATRCRTRSSLRTLTSHLMFTTLRWDAGSNSTMALWMLTLPWTLIWMVPNSIWNQDSSLQDLLLVMDTLQMWTRKATCGCSVATVTRCHSMIFTWSSLIAFENKASECWNRDKIHNIKKPSWRRRRTKDNLVKDI